MEGASKRLDLIIAVSGASGGLYAVELLRALARLVTGESTLIVSGPALRVYRDETGSTVTGGEAYLDEVLAPVPESARRHRFSIQKHGDIGGRAASGSTRYDGMVIVPCSMKTLAGVAVGYANNATERAADVCLKERRRLVLVPRETPLNTIHLRNMLSLSEAGAVILPAAPGFYQLPRELADLGRFIAGRILAIFDIYDHDLYQPWDGTPPGRDRN